MRTLLALGRRTSDRPTKPTNQPSQRGPREEPWITFVAMDMFPMNFYMRHDNDAPVFFVCVVKIGTNWSQMTCHGIVATTIASWCMEVRTFWISQEKLYWCVLGPSLDTCLEIWSTVTHRSEIELPKKYAPSLFDWKERSTKNKTRWNQRSNFFCFFVG